MAEKKKGGFMNKLMNKDSRHPTTSDGGAQTSANLTPSSAARPTGADSTYGSDLGSRTSYNGSATSSNDMTPQPGEQRQYVNDQGQVVTTTTTTTTTTTSAGSSSHHEDRQSGQGNYDQSQSWNSSGTYAAEGSNNNPGPHSSRLANSLDPNVPGNQTQYGSRQGGAPDIPNRSLKRDSYPSSGQPVTNSADPAANNGHNFSYPNRNPGTSSTGMPGSSVGSGSETLQGLKSAVGGIHGAGEALRGTFNSAVDKRFNDADAYAKNRAVADTGRQEIENARLNGPNSQSGNSNATPVKGILRRREGDGGYRQ